mgnify:FL=1
MIKQFYILRNLKDNCLHWIERISGRIHNWAWDRRWKHRDKNEWVKGYREWKKRGCPHN